MTVQDSPHVADVALDLAPATPAKPVTNTVTKPVHRLPV